VLAIDGWLPRADWKKKKINKTVFVALIK
jgi:hypothetical protein